MIPTVYVEQLHVAADRLTRQFDEAADSIGLVKHAQDVRVVFIKPNLTFPSYKKGVTTRVEFVEEVTRLLLRINPRLKIFIGEGEGGYNSFSMSAAMQTMGFMSIAERHSNVEIVNLSHIPRRAIELSTPKGPYVVDLPEIFFNDVDVAISCPLPKIHCMTILTLSYKNIWGCLPDVMRLQNHYMFPFIIARVAEALKFRYAFLDGKYGLTRYGPMSGDAVEVNWFVAANSLGAFDAVIAKMMGFDWRTVPHLRQIGRYGLVPDERTMRVLGSPEALARSFHLRRGFWAYPALAAFHSKHLTRLFYLSRYAKAMHDVMYTFRKRDIRSVETAEE